MTTEQIVIVPMMERVFLKAGAILGFIAVGAGAMASHALPKRISPEAISTFELAVRYEMYHALTLIGVGLLSAKSATLPIKCAGLLMIGGTIIFCGTLYALSLSGQQWWGALTPVGGITLMAGWICLVWAVCSMKL